jgi:hypothetical protein
MKRPCGTDEKQKTGRSIYGKVGKDKGISQKNNFTGSRPLTAFP